jgi:urate oxidase
MALTASSYGKARVRVLRLAREGDHHVPRELTLQVMLSGAFDAAWTAADNRACIATDSMKNIVNVTAARHLGAGTEEFVGHVAALFLETYPQVAEVVVEANETRWLRHSIAGMPHGHTFVLHGNGTGYVKLTAGRDISRLQSGLRGYTFMKTTRSGWAGFVDDGYRTLPDTADRIAATSMDATWTWSRAPADFAASNSEILATLMEVFATTYSASIQDSLYRMGEAALARVPEVLEIAFAMPNKHYLPIDLAPFGLENPGAVFLPTDEPHGQIEATITRD